MPSTRGAGARRLGGGVCGVFAGWGRRTAACVPVCDVLSAPRASHHVEVVSGLREREAAALLRRFFVERRSSASDSRSRSPDTTSTR